VYLDLWRLPYCVRVSLVPAIKIQDLPPVAGRRSAVPQQAAPVADRRFDGPCCQLPPLLHSTFTRQGVMILHALSVLLRIGKSGP